MKNDKINMHGVGVPHHLTADKKQSVQFHHAFLGTVFLGCAFFAVKDTEESFGLR